LAWLWAVHISDGVLQWPWLAGGFLLAALLAWLGSRRLDAEEIPRIAVLSSAFFVASSIHIRSPVPGTSIHLLLNGLLGVILGPRAALAIPVGVLLQAILLAHGGISTIGINACVMELPALLSWLVFGVVKRASWFRRPLGRWLVGFGLGGVSVLITAALNAMVLWLGGADNWPELASFAFLAHLPIVVVEAFIMAATINFLARVKPEMLGLQLTTPPDPLSQEKPRTERQAG
jgi:cobalt/nickel transport system permease protein